MFIALVLAPKLVYDKIGFNGFAETHFVSKQVAHTVPEIDRDETWSWCGTGKVLDFIEASHT
jgi:hypothetical protein